MSLYSCAQNNHRAQLPHELYQSCLDLLHRLMAYLKKYGVVICAFGQYLFPNRCVCVCVRVCVCVSVCALLNRHRVRPQVQWRELWQSLVRFLSFMCKEQLAAHPNGLKLTAKVLSVASVPLLLCSLFRLVFIERRLPRFFSLLIRLSCRSFES